VSEGGDRGGGGGGEVEEAGLAVGRQGEEAVAGHGERLDELAAAAVPVERRPEGGVDGNIDLTGITGREPDTLEFSELKADKEGAISAVVRGAREAGDIISGSV